jgi:hypothetical protein
MSGHDTLQKQEFYNNIDEITGHDGNHHDLMEGGLFFLHMPSVALKLNENNQSFG